MNAKALYPTAVLIVAAGMSIGDAQAELALDTTPITQELCTALYQPHTPRAHIPRVPQVSTKLIEEKVLDTSDWPRHLKRLHNDLAERDFRSGTYTSVDCVRTPQEIRVNQLDYTLDNLYRQGTSDTYWRFSMEAEEIDGDMLRMIKLDLPRFHEWQVNQSGDGLIAQEYQYHPSYRNEQGRQEPLLPVGYENNTNPVGDAVNAVNTPSFVKRIRVTELTRDGRGIKIVQHYTNNGNFSQRLTWSLR